MLGPGSRSDLGPARTLVEKEGPVRVVVEEAADLEGPEAAAASGAELRVADALAGGAEEASQRLGRPDPS